MYKSKIAVASHEGVKDVLRMKPPYFFKKMLKKRGYSGEAVEEIWKWYDYQERKGVNF